MSPEVLRLEVIPQFEAVGLIYQEEGERRKMKVYPTVTHTYNKLIFERVTAKAAADQAAAEALVSVCGSNGGVNQEKNQQTLQQPSQPPPPSIDNILEEIITKCMLDREGNRKGYFTKDDFIYALIMRPNEHWTEDQAEQTLQALIEEGKVVEFEQGRFKPTTT